MRGLCHHYGVELHNFAPNAISQAATFVGVCEGFLGILVNWDLWVHLFRAELHTLTTHEPRVRRAVRASVLSISLRDSRREFYIPCTMTSNNAEWERGWFYLRNDDPGLPPTPARCLRRRLTLGITVCSPSSPQDRAGVGPARVEVPGGRWAGRGFGPRQPPPQEDRPPHGEGAPYLRDGRDANPVSLARSWLLHDRFLWSMRP
jgi:hypothetical protein